MWMKDSSGAIVHKRARVSARWRILGYVILGHALRPAFSFWHQELLALRSTSPFLSVWHKQPTSLQLVKRACSTATSFCQLKAV